MKLGLLIPLSLAIAVAIGWQILRAAGRDPHLHEMSIALAPALLGGLAALVIPMLQRPHGQASVVQGSLYGMVLHLGLTLFGGVALFLIFRIQGAQMLPYALWLMWFFWVSLSAVAVSLIRLVRATPFVPAQLPKQ